MLIIAIATISVLVLSYILLKTRKTDLDRLAEPRAPLATMGVQIICGDCSGQNEIPVKTYLNRSGSCDQCGGFSFVLASDLALQALQMRAARLSQYQSASDGGRVLAFETSASRANRTKKIAV